MNEEEAKLLAEVLEALYSDYPYAITARAYKGLESGYDMGWYIFLDDGNHVNTRDKFYSKEAVLETIRGEVKI
jgi:hypothetical protein